TLPSVECGIRNAELMRGRIRDILNVRNAIWTALLVKIAMVAGAGGTDLPSKQEANHAISPLHSCVGEPAHRLRLSSLLGPCGPGSLAGRCEPSFTGSQALALRACPSTHE